MNSIEVRQADQLVGNKEKQQNILTEETSTKHDMGETEINLNICSLFDS